MIIKFVKQLLNLNNDNRGKAAQSNSAKVRKAEARAKKNDKSRLQMLDQLFDMLEARAQEFATRDLTHEVTNKEFTNLIDSIWNMIYSSSISTFCSGLSDSYIRFNLMKEEEFELLKPLITKWDINRDKTQFFDEAAFNEFKTDLRLFSKKYPDFYDDGTSMIDTFDHKVWRTYFQDYFDRAVKIVQQINKVIAAKGNRLQSILDSQFSLISPYEFEKLIASLFSSMGYQTKVTSQTNDYGIDVIAKKEHDTIAIQVKKHRIGNNVGNRDVQRILGAMQLRTVRANKAILITTSDFTVQAIEQAKKTPVELWNGEYLNKIIKKYMPT